jgi:hypothetical protein
VGGDVVCIPVGPLLVGNAVACIIGVRFCKFSRVVIDLSVLQTFVAISVPFSLYGPVHDPVS